MDGAIETFGIALQSIAGYLNNDPVNACFSIIIIILASKLVYDMFEFTKN